nr:MAG TPA: hypothetical protein [Caudoviricetes sp.]
MNFSRTFYEFFMNLVREIRPIRFNSIKCRQSFLWRRMIYFPIKLR